jgi:hypothetical protein
MTNILTATQAANALRTASDDPRMLDLLPQIDKLIERATGRDWTQDATIHPIAVSAATMLLVQWFENPGMIGDSALMSFGLTAAVTILEAEALKYRKYEFVGSNGSGAISLPGALEGDTVLKLVGVYGVSGSQTASFESSISETGYIQQTSTSDLSENHYVVVVRSPADEVGR